MHGLELVIARIRDRYTVINRINSRHHGLISGILLGYILVEYSTPLAKSRDGIWKGT
jgi:hypothetical protein